MEKSKLRGGIWDENENGLAAILLTAGFHYTCMHLLHMVVLYIAYHWDVKAGPFHAFSMPTLLSLCLSFSLYLTLSFSLTRSFTCVTSVDSFCFFWQNTLVRQKKKHGEKLFINGLSINCCRVPSASKQTKTGC